MTLLKIAPGCKLELEYYLSLEYVIEVMIFGVEDHLNLAGD